MKVQILIDNNDSWMWDFIKILKKDILKLNYTCNILKSANKVEKGEILILLSCNKIFNNLNLNKYNLVVHESDLPKGRGFSPVSWQIILGQNTIPICLFEADKSVDCGRIYFKDVIKKARI